MRTATHLASAVAGVQGEAVHTSDTSGSGRCYHVKIVFHAI
jgi:hypothetical protein